MITNGYKVTQQREATIWVLLENDQDHMSAEDVFMILKAKVPEIGLATVYRTLELLSELHIVEKMTFGDGITRFDLRNQNHEHMHHHVICKECEFVREIQEDWLHELEERIARRYGFVVTDHRLDFVGVYNKCEVKSCKKHVCAVVS
ncbi:MAG: transcriptional repressor [Paenibacillus sp.]|nr:transcriptional repressor [Paenibacillus sp.]